MDVPPEFLYINNICSKMEIKNWLINWFTKNSDIKLEDITNNINDDYLAKGWIDSFKFISLIDDIEQEFKIKFLNEEFQKKSFSTISGLAKIIEEKN